MPVPCGQFSQPTQFNKLHRVLTVGVALCEYVTVVLR